MRKILFVLLLLCGLSGIACAKKTPAKKPATIVNPNDTISHPVYLTKADLLKKVMNYEVNKEKWVYEGDKPCIIDFYTVWCGPCKRLAPVLEELAAEYMGKIYIYKVDAEKELELSQVFGINSYPTLIFCPMNGNPSKILGALPKDDLKNAINQILLGQPAPPQQ